ncbi:MAG: hypothetical protein P4L33_12925 [Capsulimonadaceae bacterium]|nr:hypothetical protein [Capsulimonadaceae bacterium]
MPKCDVRNIVNGALLVAFVAALAAVMARHEPWVDEVRAWQIVVDSHSPGDVVSLSRHELHPALWYFALYAVKLLHGGIAGMQVAHLLFATAVAALILYRSPFPMALRVAFILSYVLFYEYGVISRNYAPGILFLFAACSVSVRTGRGFLLAAILLALAMQANVFSWLIAAVYGALLIGRALLSRRRGAQEPDARRIVAASAIMLGGLFVSLAQFYPPSDFASPIERVPLSGMELVASVARITRALFAVPVPDVHFWNTNQVTASLGSVPAALLGIALLAISGFLLRRSPFAFTFFAAATLAVLLAVFVMETRAARHIDHFFIVLIMAMWLAYGEQDNVPEAEQRWRTLFLAIIAAVQFAGMAVSVCFDWQLPFDRSREAAACIRTNHLENLPIFGYEDYNASAVGAYLNRPVYYPQSGRTETFVHQVQGRVSNLPPPQLAASLASFVAGHPEGSIIVLSPAQRIPGGDQRLRVIGQFGEPSITGLTYTVIHVMPVK